MRIPLKSLKFLALDCQTTGNNKKLHHLLEIGWLAFEPHKNPSPEAPIPSTFLIRPPGETQLSSRIKKLTGIGEDQMRGAVRQRHALEALGVEAGGVARHNQMPGCPTVIHYARFEMSFLPALQRPPADTSKGVFDVICTHKVASRLIPQLPRKGIRAVAGYLGHSVPVHKRCSAHLIATAHIWRHLVALLEDQANVHTWDELQQWLKQSNPPATAKSYPMPRELLRGLPDKPGIYRMCRSNGDVLYIGKATSLKKRINSYFQKKRHSETILEMLSQARKLAVTPSPSALEAALLETDAIKEIEPPYNIALTKADRKLIFTSRDFASQADTISKACPLGPVPSPDPFIAIHAIGKYLKEKNKPGPDLPRMMAMPNAYCPDETTFLTGLDLFRQRHDSVLGCMELGRAALHIGRRTWAERLASATGGDLADESTARLDQEEDAYEWTPDAVASSLESICRRCGFQLRRASWFTMLSDARVTWRSRDSQGDLNTILLEKGQIVQPHPEVAGTAFPPPPSPDSDYPRRRSRINLATYDRLRVLTTELRRLQSERRLDRICLGPGNHLLPAQIITLLNWL